MLCLQKVLNTWHTFQHCTYRDDPAVNTFTFTFTKQKVLAQGQNVLVCSCANQHLSCFNLSMALIKFAVF